MVSGLLWDAKLFPESVCTADFLEVYLGSSTLEILHPEYLMNPHEHKTREAWLVAALWGFIDAHFTAAGYDIPSNIRVTCGWPAKHALARKQMRIGECWDMTSSDDKTFEISVSPALDDPSRVLAILIHEVVHATVGLDAGHRAPFSQCAKAVGLLKPWTKTKASDGLKMDIAVWLKTLGVYPHAALGVKYGVTPDGKVDKTILVPPRTSNPSQKTRMLKLCCDDCGCIARTTKKWIEKYGETWTCPCGESMVLA